MEGSCKPGGDRIHKSLVNFLINDRAIEDLDSMELVGLVQTKWTNEDAWI